MVRPTGDSPERQPRPARANPPVRSFEVIVIGAGFAGAATAHGLVQEGVRDVLVIEQEAKVGCHASGLNAGLVRRACEDLSIAALAHEGADVISGIDGVFRPTGSILIGGDRRIPDSLLAHPAHRTLSPAAARERVPLLDRATSLDGGIIATPQDGVVDPRALLDWYLQRARDGGARVLTGVRALEPRIHGKRVVGVETSAGPLSCAHLVLACGPWAAHWGELGGVPVQLRPYRRHLVFTERPRDFDATDLRHWPWVWDLQREYYFRPYEDGLLWCFCDDDPAEPGRNEADPSAPLRFRERLGRQFPEARGLEIRRHWAGLRTLAPDRRFLLGPETRLRGWHWVAALGGHGVAVSAAVGRRVAAAIATGNDDAIDPSHRVRSAVIRDGKRRSIV